MGAAPGKALGAALAGLLQAACGRPPLGAAFPGPLGGAALGGGPWGRPSLGAVPGKALGAAFAGLLQAACGKPLLGAAFPHGPPCLAFAFGRHRAWGFCFINPFGPPWAALLGLCLGGLRGFPQSCFGSRWAAFNRIRFPLGCLGSHWAARIFPGPHGLFGLLLQRSARFGRCRV